MGGDDQPEGENLGGEHPEGEKPEVRSPSKGGNDEQLSCLWQAASRRSAPVLEKYYGLTEPTLTQTLKDKEDSAACVLMDSTGKILHATLGFEKLIGMGRGYEKAVKQENLAELLRPADTELDEVINGNRWGKMAAMRLRASQMEADDEDKDPEQSIELMLSKFQDGKLSWCLFHAFTVGKSWQVVVFAPLTASTPKSLDGWTTESVAFAKHEVQSLGLLVQRLHDDVRADPEKKETVMSMVPVVELACTTFVNTWGTAFRGNHFVPLVGSQSAKAFEEKRSWEALCNYMQNEIRVAFDVSEDKFLSIKCNAADSIACTVSDPSAPDCPLLFISQGFEHLTQYTNIWALGRNSRFLQPKDLKKNHSLNAPEIDRIENFCANCMNGVKAGSIITLQLHEKADGCSFWDLVFTTHAKVKGRSYVFAVHTHLETQQEIIDGLVLDCWDSGFGEKNLARLREALQKEEDTYSPRSGSLIKLANDTVSAWAFEAGRNNTTYWEGASYVPKVGRPAVEEFVGVWPSLLEEAAEGIRSLFEMTEATFCEMQANDNDAVVCAVSDPTALDCPLVFLSQGFENMTGYRNDFGLGRNCRFLQPNMKLVNQKVNGEELARMREFCHNFGPERKGKRIINLLLNERITGERFWNLLHMEHVMANGKPYILGVQTILEMPMPMLLKNQQTSRSIEEYDSSWLTTFVDDLSFFLSQLRGQLQRKLTDSMGTEADMITKSIMNFMRRNCGDYEGDHQVARVGYQEAEAFERDKIWKSLLLKVSSLLTNIWDISEFNDEEVACAVSDPNGPDCPLVYVSQKFERLTGYTRDWVLGRNCRFLQPNDSYRNDQFNLEDRCRMREFCAGPQPEGTRIFNLLINESKAGYPFWNLLVMEHIDINGKDFIFAVQTSPDIEISRLTEILTLDEESVPQLNRLRHMFREKETTMEKAGLQTIASSIIRQWVADFPVHLEMPRFNLGGHKEDIYIPLAGILLSPQEPLGELIHAGLEEGVRHFALALGTGEFIDDTAYVEKASHLLTLRFAELLNKMRMKYLHYLRQAIVFTLISKPQYVNSFKGISKALASYGYGFRIWLLDVRAYNSDKLASKAAGQALLEHWNTMSEACKAGDVKVIGLFGPISSIMPVMQVLKSARTGVPASVFAIDDHPLKEQDPSRLSRFKKLYFEEYGSPKLITYGLFGPKNCFLENVPLKDVAQEMGVDVSTLLVKWAEAQNYGVLLPGRITDGEVDIANKEASWPRYHRNFTRMYARSPGCGACSPHVMEALQDSSGPVIRRGSKARTSFQEATRSSEFRRQSTKDRAVLDQAKEVFEGMLKDRRASGTANVPMETARRNVRARTVNPRRHQSTGGVEDMKALKDFLQKAEIKEEGRRRASATTLPALKKAMENEKGKRDGQDDKGGFSSGESSDEQSPFASEAKQEDRQSKSAQENRIGSKSARQSGRLPTWSGEGRPVSVPKSPMPSSSGPPSRSGLRKFSKQSDRQGSKSSKDQGECQRVSFGAADPQPPSAPREHPSNPARAAISLSNSCDEATKKPATPPDDKNPPGKSATFDALGDLDRRQLRQAEKLRAEGWTAEKVAEFLECDVDQLYRVWGG